MRKLNFLKHRRQLIIHDNSKRLWTMDCGLWTILVLFSLICLLSSVIGCSKRKKTVEKSTIPVSVMEVTKADLEEALFYVGDIKAQEQIEVYPRISGKLLENLVKEGQKISKGDVIAYIDRDEIGFQFEKAPVRSPIKGIVGSVYLDRGTTVSSQIAVAKIVDMDVVKIRINVMEMDLPKVKEGQFAEISIDAYPNEIFKGFVERISPVVDIDSRTARAEIEIANPDYKLKPGMFARVNIVVRERKSVLFILRDTIVKDDGEKLKYVFVVDGNGVSKRKVDLGLKEDLRFEVTNGLQEGDLVVITGEEYLKDGSIIEIVDDYKE